ncbi:hypothetical protein [Pontibacillus salipaludis]|uniref:Lipoprotein n=1 Tax=Pontibacillus salipaludis TaxID=1697394 RepID=A0ABQ1Q5Q9_9BACI|nr:hypothetical protein [Pontibacillus salipaludis]GGD12884.1 hypothetical protein GCM10011389_20540 [Pontibacillus salipaludis]
MRRIYLMMVGLILLLLITGCGETSTDLDEYLNSGTSIDSEASSFMPSLSKLPEYEDVEYTYSKNNMLFYQSESISLVVEYDEDTYKSEKKRVKEAVDFLEEPVLAFTSDGEEKYGVPEEKFKVNSYTFNVEKNSKIAYPKRFGMIGMSDQKQRIAYLYFLDTELDYISGSMEEFVKKYFNYRF